MKMDNRNLTMLMDLYEMTMANGIMQSDMRDTITYFDMFFRRVPDGGGYAIAAGLQQVVEYINDKKLTAAKQRIKESDLTLTEISDELGFLSIHYFTRFFKAKTGMSPKAYREAVRGK